MKYHGVNKYKVRYGRVPRTIDYSDDSGDIFFTFDYSIGKKKSIILDVSYIQGDPVRYAFAIERVRVFLESKGYEIIVCE